jgi:hypothetical protein
MDPSASTVAPGASKYRSLVPLGSSWSAGKGILALMCQSLSMSSGIGSSVLLLDTDLDSAFSLSSGTVLWRFLAGSSDFSSFFL